MRAEFGPQSINPLSSANPTEKVEYPVTGLTGWFARWASDWGKAVIDGISAVGDFSLFIWRTLTWLFTRLPRKETLWPNFYQVGVSSLPVVALTGSTLR